MDLDVAQTMPMDKFLRGGLICWCLRKKMAVDAALQTFFLCQNGRMAAAILADKYVIQIPNPAGGQQRGLIASWLAAFRFLKK
jgi:hypothetical protein